MRVPKVPSTEGAPALRAGVLSLVLALAGMGLTPPCVGAPGANGAPGPADAAAGRTELMNAARRGHYERVLSLLDAGEDVNQANRNGGTPLMYAALGGHPRIIALLLDRGGNINATASNGWGPLMIAVAKGYDQVVRLLLREGADPNLPDIYLWTPLMRAVREQRLRTAETLLEDPRTEVNQRGENDATALHLAAAQGDQAMVRLLLQYGAVKVLEDASGRTAYTVAAQAGDAALMRLLRH